MVLISLKNRFRESNKRSLVKSITYRVYQSFLVTPLIAYFLTQNLVLSLKFSVVEFFVKIPAYYLFERLWALIPHGYKIQTNIDHDR
ncbi:DUF2061 domain-containing protein [Desulfurococcaceae archaeon MEX13E-LK6-19]|nr:DUF2061 domain-containing protein [Desulfurococcaceae archaeon MEX13E-LK6-19]